MVSSITDVDRMTSYPADGEVLDQFTTKELGGRNKKLILVHYLNGQVDQKSQKNVE